MYVVSRLGIMSAQRMNCRVVGWEPDVLALHSWSLVEASAVLASLWTTDCKGQTQSFPL